MDAYFESMTGLPKTEFMALFRDVLEDEHRRERRESSTSVPENFLGYLEHMYAQDAAKLKTKKSKKKPDDRAPRDDQGRKICAFCGIPAAPNHELRACSRCRVVSYCNAECQKKGWKAHKPHCTRPVG